MRKIYQNKWHDIELAPLLKAQALPTHLPNAEFYATYYRDFFGRYPTQDALSSEWRALKRSVADALEQSWIPSPQSRILSVGCGAGVIEIDLWKRGYHDLEVSEVCAEALPWLRAALPPEQIHVGDFPDCVRGDAPFDLIFFCTIDYVFDSLELVHFLRTVRTRLAPGGKALLVTHGLLTSNVFLQNWLNLRDWLSSVKRAHQKTSKDLFWGYQRSREEYAEAFRRAGFAQSAEVMRSTGTEWTNYFRSGSA